MARPRGKDNVQYRAKEREGLGETWTQVSEDTHPDIWNLTPGLLAAMRLRRLLEWSILDYADEHAAPAHRPPETVEEYEAERIQKSVAGVRI